MRFGTAFAQGDANPQRLSGVSGEEHLEAERRPAVPFLGGALFSDNIVVMSDYL